MPASREQLLQVQVPVLEKNVTAPFLSPQTRETI